MKRCTRCLLPETYPDLVFDANGQCNVCLAYDERWANHDFMASAAELRKIFLAASKRKRGKYDCLVPFSGGKDSTYALYLCTRVYNLKPLAMNFNNWFQSPGTNQLMDKVVGTLGVDLRRVAIDPNVMQRLYRACVERKADICTPCEMGIYSTAYQVAAEAGIPLIVFGTSVRTEGIIPKKMYYHDGRYFADVIKGRLKRREVEAFLNLEILRMARLVLVKRIQFIQLPLYVKWHEEEMRNIIRRETGWEEPKPNEAHFDCLINPVADYFFTKRWGFGKGTIKQATLLRCGQVERREALQRIEREAAEEVPTESLAVLVNKLGLTETEIAPFISGDTYDYTHFKTYRSLLLRLRGLLWLGAKLHLVPEDLTKRLLS
jgi:N-acetyl sugar amidotransferase